MDKPSLENLLEIRKKLKKNKAPKIHGGMKAFNPEIGGFEVIPREDELEIRWNILKNGNRISSGVYKFSQLCTEPEFEKLRLDVGWLIADLLELEANNMLQSIPGPNEAIKESEFYRKLASTWRHWAQVEAGFMIFE
jgi:hypothetical protein